MRVANKTPLPVLEQKVIAFLSNYAKDAYALHVTTPHLAKTSLEKNHLYEDLGFANRVQMGKYMQEHFPTLCAIKPADKLWKKFIYDSIGEIAPACENCSDQDNCWACRV